MRPDPQLFHQHYNYVQVYRRNLLQTLREIKSGVVDEEQLDKLHNFVLMALKLMEKTPLSQLRLIWQDIEIMGFVHPEDDQHAVILDPNKQPPMVINNGQITGQDVTATGTDSGDSEQA